jgi:hypothetical protein
MQMNLPHEWRPRFFMAFPLWETSTENPRVGGRIPLPAIVQRAELRCQMSNERIDCLWLFVRSDSEEENATKIIRNPNFMRECRANSPGIAEARLTNFSKHETSERSHLSYQKRSTDCAEIYG